MPRPFSFLRLRQFDFSATISRTPRKRSGFGPPKGLWGGTHILKQADARAIQAESQADRDLRRTQAHPEKAEEQKRGHWHRCAERAGTKPKRNGVRHPKLICGCISGWKLVLIDAGIKRCSLAIAEGHEVLAPGYDTTFCIKTRF